MEIINEIKTWYYCKDFISIDKILILIISYIG